MRTWKCGRCVQAISLRSLDTAHLEAAGEIDHEHVFFVETGEPFRSLHHPQRRWRKTLQSLKVRCRRPYTARQTSVSWSLMAGKNPLRVAKQHGHSIATMLRAYAAWAEGTAEVDVEAIKRSMNASEAPPAINLAVHLSVAEALQAKRALEARPTRTARTCANRLFRHGEMAVSQTTENLAGVAGLFGPAGLTPSGPPAAR
jgi:transposase